MARKRLGDVLRERKHIAIEDLERTLAEQAQSFVHRSLAA